MTGTQTDSLRDLAAPAGAESPGPEPAAPSSGNPTPEAQNPAGTHARIGREEPGRYQLLRELARGGQGVVHVAWDAHLGREVAFKQLLAAPPGGRSLDSLTPKEARFVREARITAQLDHPGIAPVHEVGRRADGSIYVTQKLVRGRTLAAALAKCQSLKERMALLQPLLGVFQAVAFAHGRGVIHRDLKPGNVLLGDLGETVVLDWGLGRTSDEVAQAADAPPVDSMLETDAVRTREGALIGTPAYMSPEQAIGGGTKADARADVWSLGVILYELLTGRRPFEDASSEDVLRAVATAPLRPIRELCPDVPPELAEVAEHALRRDPAARYPSAHELAAELAAWLSGGRVVAHEYSSLELARRFVGRNRTLVTFLAAMFLFLLASVLVLFARSRAQEHLLGQNLLERSRAAAQQLRWNEAAVYAAGARLHEDSAEARWAAAQVGAVETTLLAHWRVGVGAGEADNLAPDGAWFSLNRPARKVDAATGKLTPVEGAPEGCESVSDDGATLACFERSGFLVAGAADGKLRWRSAAGRPVSALSIDPQGRTIAAGGTDGQITLFDAATGAERGRPGRQAKAVTGLAFSPDGRRLVSAAGEVAVWDLATGVRLAAFEAGADTAWFLPDGRIAASGKVGAEIRELGAPSAAWKAKGWSTEWPAVPCRGNANLVAAPIAAGAGEGETILWDLRVRRPIARLPGFGGAFSSDCGRLLTWNPLSRTARIWRIGETAWRGVGAAGHAGWAVVFTARGRFVWVDSFQDKFVLRSVDLASGRELAGAEGGRRPVLTASPDGALLAELHYDAAAARRRVRVRSADDLRVLSTIDGHRFAFTADPRLLATASMDGRVRFWDARTGSLEREVATGAVQSIGYPLLAASPDGRLLGIGDGNGVYLWNLATGAPEGWRRLTRPTRAGMIGFSASGRLWVIDEDGVASFLPADRQDQPFARTTPYGQVDRSGDGRVLLLAAHDQPTLWDRDRLTLWDLESGEHLLDVPQSVPGDLAVSHDGLTLAVATGEEPAVMLLSLRPPLQGASAADELSRRLQLPTRTLQGTAIVEAPPAIAADDPGSSLGAAPVNAGFEEGAAGELPPGWSAGGQPESAPPVTSAERPFAGARCARLEALRPSPARVSAELWQAIDARPFRGKAVRLRGALRAEMQGSGHASLWIRSEGQGGRWSYGKDRFGEREDRPVTSSEWQESEVRTRVAEDADHLVFGAILVGAGKAWLDEVSLEVIE